MLYDDVEGEKKRGDKQEYNAAEEKIIGNAFVPVAVAAAANG